MFLQGLKGFPGVKGERVSNSHLIYTVPVQEGVVVGSLSLQQPTLLMPLLKQGG